jgi:PAS domain S-box-containing protein
MMNGSFAVKISENAIANDELRSIIDTIPMHVWRCRADGFVDFLNKRCLDYTGSSLDVGLGFGWRDELHPEDLATFQQEWFAILASGTSGEAKARLKRFDGEYRSFLFRVEPMPDTDGNLNWFGTSIDIEDRQRAEDHIHRGKKELQLAIDTIPVSMFRADPDGAMNFFNKRWREYTGLEIEDATGWRWAERGLFHPDDMQSIKDAWQAVLSEPKAGEVEVRMRRFDGEYRWHLIRAHPLLDDHGNVIQWYGTNTDLEDRRIAEQALLKTQSELAYLTRVTTLNEMVASIAHEVNQPLSAIVTNAEAALRWLSRGEAGLAEVRSALQRIVADADRAGAIIHGIRELSKKADPIFVPLDINEVVSEVVMLMEHEITSHGVSLRTDFAGERLIVRGDRVQLQQVVINLMMNGMEAMNSISTRPRRLAILTARDATAKICVSISDVGPGFEASNAPRLFEAFYSSKPQGMGMGLAICRSIIEAHGGKLSAANNVDHGATFHMLLDADGMV